MPEGGGGAGLSDQTGRGTLMEIGVSCGSWAPGLCFPTLKEQELHVWRASLDCGADAQQSYEQLLWPEEKERAAKFLVNRTKEEFTVARGILRELLGRYLGQRPETIEFCYSAEGKPGMATRDRELPLQFNVSHSHGIAVFAFALRKTVGIDLEEIRADFAAEEIAGRYFGKKEITELEGAPRELRPEMFFKLWSRKEAYLKARGKGLQIPLRSFEVSAQQDCQELRDETGMRWSLYAFEPMDRFAGAVAAEGSGWTLSYWDWEHAQPERHGASIGRTKAANCTAVRERFRSRV